MIREATIEDLNEIINIWKDGAIDAYGIEEINPDKSELIYPIFTNQIKSQNENHKFWVYTDENNIAIAYCSLLPFHPSPLRFDKWAILSLYVDKNYQNHSLGYQLLKHALDYTSKTTIKYVFSTVAQSNIRVKRLAEKTGWKFMGTLPRNNDNNEFTETEVIIFEA